MQVTLNIDSANIGGPVEQVFATLSDADKKDLAKQVMLEVLHKPMTAEREAFACGVCEKLVADYANDSYPGNRIKTVEEARKHYKFNEAMSKFKSSTDRMMEEITRSACTHYKQMVDELVKSDEQIQQVMCSVRDQFAKDFPAVLNSAMIQYFANQMGSIGTAIATAANANMNVGFLSKNIQTQLSNNGIHIQMP